MIDLSFDVWKNILLALVVAFVISFAATPVVSSFAKKVGAIDIPDKKRHIHSHPIPRMGGLAIFLGFLLSVLLFANITPQVRGILLGAILIVVVGAIVVEKARGLLAYGTQRLDNGIADGGLEHAVAASVEFLFYLIKALAGDGRVDVHEV